MFLCQRLIGASADKYSCIYTILSVHCDLHYSSYNSHSSAPSMSSALRPDGEAPHHEQPLIMSSISGGFEYSHKKVCRLTRTVYTQGKRMDACLDGSSSTGNYNSILDPRCFASQQLRGAGQETSHPSLSLFHKPHIITSNTSLSQIGKNHLLIMSDQSLYSLVLSLFVCVVDKPHKLSEKENCLHCRKLQHRCKKYNNNK